MIHSRFTGRLSESHENAKRHNQQLQCQRDIFDSVPTSCSLYYVVLLAVPLFAQACDSVFRCKASYCISTIYNTFNGSLVGYYDTLLHFESWSKY